MDGKHLARIGAAGFVGIAAAMALVELRETPQPPVEPRAAAWAPDGDPLPAQLRACSAMGERALAMPDCRAAWAEKRRRFFGVDHPGAYEDFATAAPTGAAEAN